MKRASLPISLLLAQVIGCGSVIITPIPGDTSGTGGAPPSSSSATSSSVTSTTVSSSTSASSTSTAGSGGASCVPLDDANPCTEDLCDNDLPIHVPHAEGASCSDGDACSANDTCQAGACVPGPPVECSGPTSCVAGACVPAGCTGEIVHLQPASPTVSYKPSALVAADLNGDGVVDLAAANSGNSTVSVLLGQGNGTFAPKVQYDVMNEPISIAAADVDGDGQIDLVTANTYAENVGVLHNLGNGTFGIPVNYFMWPHPFSVTAVDLSGDGMPDLVVVGHFESDVRVLLNQGDGTFAPFVSYVVKSDPGVSVRAVTTADLNGDGLVDLIAVSTSAAVVSLLFNQGNGTFAASVDVAVSEFPAAVVAADLDGDGLPDLAVAGQGYEKVAILINLGNGTFPASPPAPVYPSGPIPDSILATDFNGDGLLDLALGSLGGNGLNVLLNQGNATFAAPIHIPLGESPALIAADLNGDGAPDLAALRSDNDTVDVLLNTCAP